MTHIQPNTEPALQARNLEKSYDSTSILKGVSLEVAPGEILGIMGPSGAGKSTLLNILGGIDRPDRGSIHLGGRDLTRIQLDELALVRRREIGTVFQFFHLLPTLSVEENIRFPLLLNGESGSSANQRVHELLDRTGLSPRAHALPDELSGGEMQRTAIARALAVRPLLLLADEPTGNLDSQTGEQILVLLQELARESATAMIMVTHSDEAAAICHRVITLRDGHIVPPTE